jgi:hypothetical protein
LGAILKWVRLCLSSYSKSGLITGYKDIALKRGASITNTIRPEDLRLSIALTVP